MPVTNAQATTHRHCQLPPIPFGSVMNNENTDQLHWWQKPFANVQTNLQEIDATMDVEKALDVIEAHGANSWLLNTGGIASQYPTELPFQTRIPIWQIGRPVT